MKSSTQHRRSFLRSGLLSGAGLAAWPSLFQPKQVEAAINRYEMLNPPDDLWLEPGVKAKIGSNENPFGPSPASLKAMQDAIRYSYRYTPEQNKELVKKIAEYEGVGQDQIILGAGSTELLLAAALLHGQKEGNTIISADPGYMSLVRFAQAVGAKWDPVPLTKQYFEDLDTMAARVNSNTSLVYVCNPSNPSGTLLGPEKLMPFCESVSKTKPVFVDEAYIDYVDDPKKYSMTQAVRAGYNVMVCRTMSKVQGLAGMRVGYMIGLPETVKMLKKYCVGQGVTSTLSAPAVFGALACYNDTSFYNFVRQKNKESKEFTIKTLKSLGYEYIPSSTNFMLFPIGMDQKEFVQKMKDKGVHIKGWAMEGTNYCRVSFGTMDDMQIFMATLKEVIPPAIVPMEKQKTKKG